LKTSVDAELLKRAPLTEREKLLLQRIDANGETITNVARELRKDKSTISIQDKKAVRLYNRLYKTRGSCQECETGEGIR
jgi:IS30 family transposase